MVEEQFSQVAAIAMEREDIGENMDGYMVEDIRVSEVIM